MTNGSPILEPGQLEPPAGQIPFLYLPAQGLFRRRGDRLRQLSNGNALGEYLQFLALLADAQQIALEGLPAPVLPSPDEARLCRQHGMPLFSAASWPREPIWREGLLSILQQMAQADLPTAAQETIRSLASMDRARLERQADLMLTEQREELRPNEMPFIGAALQVYWVRLASALDPQTVGRLEQAGLCPVCGSRPVAGVVRGDGLRYLSCSLCSCQWHLVRITCSNCRSTQGITLQTLHGTDDPVRAESCDACTSYLKLLYLEKDGLLDPVADDLATLALDMLLGQEGFLPVGANLLFHPGGTAE